MNSLAWPDGAHDAACDVEVDHESAAATRQNRAKLIVLAAFAIAVSLAIGFWIGASSRASEKAVSSPSAWLVQPDSQPEAIGWARPTDLPEPEPAKARELNAATPFAGGAVLAARPFLFAGDAVDRARAVDCLAIAAMAEAGGGDDGQRAVIQVVLNRVRHPAFAKSICGVVFEGSHRSTGCQFTFTCDGALARRYSQAAWTQARLRASEALDGRVYAPVGFATHYHTDWVHPYWSPKLLKLARVDTHLFFRWPGSWGERGAFQIAYGGKEPAISMLAYLPAHSEGAPALAAASMPGGPGFRDVPTSVDVVVRNEDGGAFVLLNGAPSADGARDIARRVCEEKSSCKVFGWFDRASIPAGYPVPSNLRARMGFSYFRGLRDEEIVLYDCARFASVENDRCLPFTTRNQVTFNQDPPEKKVA